MSDVYASPGDPIFWMHHLFVDRNFRIWQNANPSRKTSVSGCVDNKSPCTPLTLDTNIHVGGLRPDVRVRDVLDTMNGAMCYRYNY
jgi:tyrosinase